MKVGKTLGREARDLVKGHAILRRKRVADEQIVVADETHDIAGVGIIDGFAIARKKPLRVAKPHAFAAARVEHIHIALEFSRDNAHEGHAVAVLGIHVGLNLKNKGGKLLRRRIDREPVAFARQRRRCQLKETIEQHLHTKVVGSTSEKHRRQLTGEHLIDIEVRTRALEQFKLITHLLISRFFHRGLDAFILNAGHRHRRAIGAMHRALEEVHLLVLAIIDALEARPVAERPIQRVRMNAEHAFKLVEQIERRSRRAVELVHESENRHTAAAANFEKFPRLALNALAGIDHHHRRIDRGQHTVSVFREILVTRRVEDVDDTILVLKLENGRAHRNPALFFQLHPVGGRRTLILARRDAAGELQSATVEQEFFRQRRFAGIRVRNDRKRTTTLHLALQRGRGNGIGGK